MTTPSSHPPTPAKDPFVLERAQTSSTPPVDRGLLTLWRRHRQGRAALAALAAGALALGVGVSPAAAADWGYEQISPATSSSLDIVGIGASRDMGTVFANTRQTPLEGYPADGRGGQYFYGLPRGGKPWTLGPVDAANWSQLVTYVKGISVDGSRALFQGALLSVSNVSGGAFVVDPQGGAIGIASNQGADGSFAFSDDLTTVASKSGGALDGRVYVSTPGRRDPVVASVDNAGAEMLATGLGGATLSGAGLYGLASGAVAADGSSVIFTSTDGLPGDNDGGAADVFMRILTPGAERTIAISDPTAGGGADAATDASYRWATADHQRVFFVTNESLEPGDTDGEQDVYMRVGSGAPVRISQGETVDGAPTGNLGDLPEWVLSSRDGNRTFFVTAERLTQDAPATGVKLYERDVAEGRTRFVAGPLHVTDTSPHFGLLADFNRDINFRGLRVTPNGAVFLSREPLTGGSDIAGSRVYVWTRGGGLTSIAEPAAGAPPMAPSPATFLPGNAGALFERQPVEAGRAVSDDGSRVFFTTARALVPEDTDGNHVDVYMWTAAGGVQLVTPPGRAPYDAYYIDNSPDGNEVYFTTEESILPGDTDPNAADIYLAILGGGAAPDKPAPDADPQVCVGDACQGPIAAPAPLSIGSVSFAGPGNVLTAPRRAAASVSVAKAKTVTGSTATLQVKVPDAGQISVAGWSLRSTSVSASGAGSYAVKFVLSSAASKSLKRKKTLKVSARVSFRGADGESASTTVSVTFKQPKAKPAKTKKGGR
jgi:hypothetical protein